MGTNTQGSTNQSRQKLIAIAAIVIVALLAVNAWLLYSYTEANKAQANLSTQLEEVNALQEQLNEEYYEAKAELKALRSSNEELNGMIAEKEAELKEQKDRIASLIRKGGSSSSIKAELAQMRNKAEGYMAEINQLREQNALLADANQALQQENTQISSDLNTKIQENENLNKERAMLVSERQALSQNNEQLSRKVNMASAIRVQDLRIEGKKVRKSGTAVTRRNADNIQLLEVNCGIVVNEIADAGTEEFHMRIISPQGETLAMNQMGSGVFTNKATGESIRYTQKTSINYDQTQDALNFVWRPDTKFSAGKYTVEVYNKGFLVGTSSVVLR